MLVSKFAPLGVMAVVTVLSLAAPAHADGDFIPGGEDRFKLTVGGILTRFHEEVAFNGAALDGTPIDFQSNASNLTANFVVAGDWRITSRNRVAIAYYGAKRSRSNTTDTDIIINDTLIPAGATLDATVRNNFVFANYRYSFVKNARFELAGLVGVYGANYKFDIAASGFPSVCAGDTCSPTSGSFNNTQSTTLPLPLLGGSFNWYISPRWEAEVSLSGLKAKINNVDGSDWVLVASTEYMIWRNIGLGLTYMHNAIDVDVTKRSFTGTINGHSNNLLGYVVFQF